MNSFKKSTNYGLTSYISIKNKDSLDSLITTLLESDKISISRLLVDIKDRNIELYFLVLYSYWRTSFLYSLIYLFFI